MLFTEKVQLDIVFFHIRILLKEDWIKMGVFLIRNVHLHILSYTFLERKYMPLETLMWYQESLPLHCVLQLKKMKNDAFSISFMIS